jgi:uncharacterized protein YndB with AHSA1/START domain
MPGLIVKRLLPASPEEAFAAWTDPVALSRWMSPFGSAIASVNLQVGASFRIVMVGPDREIEHTGEYLEIDPPHRLVFTWRSPYTGPIPSQVTVELRPHAGGTELTLIHTQLPDGEVDSHRGGWGGILDHLDAYLRGVSSQTSSAAELRP